MCLWPVGQVNFGTWVEEGHTILLHNRIQRIKLILPIMFILRSKSNLVKMHPMRISRCDLLAPPINREIIPPHFTMRRHR